MQTLICGCGTPLYLSKGHYNLANDIVGNFPILKCPDCYTEYNSELAEKIIKVWLSNLDSDDTRNFPMQFDFIKIRDWFTQNETYLSTEIDFIFDKDDYYFIPGLVSPFDSGFLTPVFFNIEVLLKYTHHPMYSVELGADTYGNIYKENEVIISFGINRNGKVIMWLGDIGRLDIDEQHYLRSENIESDHDIASEFYEGQIEVKWAIPSLKNQLFKKRLELHEKTNQLYSISITQLEPEAFKAAANIAKPIVNTEKAFADVIIPMNMVFVESINSKEIKKDLKRNFSDINLDGFGSNKLFQIWIEKRFTNLNASEIASPFFILYDLRVAMAHLQSTEKVEQLLTSSCERLGLESSCRDYIKIYETLLERFINTYNKLLEELSI
ncbi:hypothetical protein [Neobacillus vireti]|uniref:hypothetical protein n=1 Tax=Neobacillus vireti TaxID=220686 RepID=UPI002FFF4F41